jgi:outer membrane cobalamin receptor
MVAGAALLIGLGLPIRAAQDQSATPPPKPTVSEVVDVVSITPVEGVGVDRGVIAANVQVITMGTASARPGQSVADLLAANAASVRLNEAQANPFQPDVQFRGFVASPLLGVPQGLAVYQDGARVNEPFGDAVNWDLLPANAIDSITLFPGSQPLFGLNALGGAVAIRTKTGFTSPGTAVHVFGGSFDRRWAEIESGGHGTSVGYFVAARLLAESGWRDDSPSRIGQLFASMEHQGQAGSTSITMTVGRNRLTGNGPAPVQLLDVDRRLIFTHADVTRSTAAQVTLNTRRALRSNLTVNATAYYHPSRIRTSNGDDTSYGACEQPDQHDLLCADDGEGEPVYDQFDRVVIRPAGEPLDGTVNASDTRSDAWGGAVEATLTRAVGRRPNHLVGGAAIDGSRSRYGSTTELASIAPGRLVVGAGLFDRDAAVGLRTGARHLSAYAADYLTIAPRLTATFAARLTHSTLRLDDQIGEALTGRHRYTRINPSAGLTAVIAPALSVYGSASTASRVPTPSELGCADPDDPCRLPNAFVSDPPLEQVVSRTIEGGARGRTGSVSWSLSAFRTVNRNDLLFVSSGALTNTGHFANIGDTRRIGSEITAVGGVGSAVRWAVSYGWLRATFASPIVLSSPNHPDAVDGELPVPAGATLPGIPRSDLKANATIAHGRLTVSGDVAAVSSQFLRGDEANVLDAIDGYVVIGAAVHVELARGLGLSLRAANLSGADYATFGLLGSADHVLGPAFDDPRFLTPGAPRSVWVGVEWRRR